MSTATAFEAVISAWNEQVRCEMATHQGARCRAVGVLARRSARLRTGSAGRTPQRAMGASNGAALSAATGLNHLQNAASEQAGGIKIAIWRRGRKPLISP